MSTDDTPPPVGTVVALVNLTTRAYNGRTATVLGPAPQPGRIGVRLDPLPGSTTAEAPLSVAHSKVVELARCGTCHAEEPPAEAQCWGGECPECHEDAIDLVSFTMIGVSGSKLADLLAARSAARRKSTRRRNLKAEWPDSGWVWPESGLPRRLDR